MTNGLNSGNRLSGPQGMGRYHRRRCLSFSEIVRIWAGEISLLRSGKKRIRMNVKSYKTLWVLVDKRGTILEHSKLRECSLKNGVQVPQFTFWRNRSSARWQVEQIRKDMTQEVWDTWEFRVVQYGRIDQ